MSYKRKPPKEYTSYINACMTALELSYHYGVEYYVCELTEKPAVYHIKQESGYPSAGTSSPRTKGGSTNYKTVLGTRHFGWHRGIYKDLGDENPYPIQHKVEAERRRYTW